MKLSLNVLPLPIWTKTLKNSLFALFVVLPIVTVLSIPASAQTATVTTLAVTSAGSPVTTVTSPAAVTLTANVTTGGAPVTHGTVNFCYSKQTACSGAGMVGAAQLTASGTAAISIHPAIGAHSYTAVFLGNTSSQAGTSTASSLTVTAGTPVAEPTVTTIGEIGYPGNMNLTGTVTGNGALTSPTGTLNFIDLTNGSTTIASVALSNPTQGVGYLNVPASTTLQNTTPLAVGDFNGDGNPDLIAKLADGTVTLQIGLGNNGFSTGATIPGGASLVAVGDFNSDGKLDVVTLANGAINVFFGDGAGNFTAAPANTPSSLAAGGISVADFNRDGNLDLAMIDGTSVTVYLGAGDGTFTAGYSNQIVTADFGMVFSSQNGIAIGDFNADGIPDIAVAWQIVGDDAGVDSEFNVSFFFGDGAGNFTPSLVTLPANTDNYVFGQDPLFGTTPGSMVIVASDLDGDGKTDISSSISYFPCCPFGQLTAFFAVYNNGDGTFTIPAPGSDTFRGAPVASTAVDITGNGTLSIANLWTDALGGIMDAGQGEPAHIDYGSGTVAVSDATFPIAFLAGDFNGDGIQEIVTGGPIATSVVGYQNSSSATTGLVAVSPPGSGIHQVEAIYAGDTTHAGSTSAQFAVSAVYATPVVTLSASSPIVFGQPVILTAILTSSGTVPVPFGYVTFFNGAASLGTSVLTGGIATLSVNSLASGTYSITASYSGDSNDNPVTSSPLSITVPLPMPTLVLTTPTPAITFGSPITLKATMKVTGTLPVANIAFMNGTTSLGSQALNASGVATLTVSAPGLPVGIDSITATFAGNSSFSAVTSAPLTVTVAKATPKLVLTSSAATVVSPAVVTLTAAVIVGNVPVTHGTVNFCYTLQTACSGAGMIGAAQLTPSGTAAISFRPAVGTHSYTAIFLGNTSDQASSSAASKLTVTAGASVAPTATTVTVSGTPGNYTLTGTVTADGKLTSPAGTLNFVDITNGSTTLASPALSNPTLGAGYLNVPATTSLKNTTPLAVGDFNGDGNPDLIAKLADGTVALQIGQGNNSFSTGATIPGGASLVAVGDFNSDGKLDVVTLANGAINVFFGDGAGHFTAAPANTPFNLVVAGISVADFNRDGNLDLAMINGTSVMVYLGAGDGTFTAGYSYEIVSNDIGETAQSQSGIAVGDFNADGIPDIAVAWQIVGEGLQADSEFNISFFFGDGAGNFTPSVVTLPAEIDTDIFGPDPLFGAPPGAMVIAASDINGDGRADISASISYIACCPGGEITADFAVNNNGDGTFTIPNPYSDLYLGPPVANVAVDISGNGTLFISTLWADAQLGPLEQGQGDPAHIDYGNGSVAVSDSSFPKAFLAGDFNGDGIQEVMVGGPIATSIIGYQTSSSATLTHVGVSPPGSGIHQVEATYAGDAAHTGSTSAPVSLGAVLATPVVTLSASSPIVAGQPVVLTATLTSSGTVPTGNVTFFNGAASLGTSVLTGGIATLSLNSLASGSYSITASYSGDSNNNPATSSPLSITVPLPTPALVLTTPTPSTTFGSPITLKATMKVTGILPAASIAFMNGTTVLGSPALDKSGVATLTVPAPGLPVGTDSITATFAGNSSFSAVTSAPLIVTVAKATPTLVLTSSAATITVGAAETLTLALPAADPAPTGTVTFLMGAATLGSSTIANGSANFTTNTLPAGKDTITAFWSGDDTFTAATSPAIVVMVAPTLTLTAASGTIYAGVSDTITIILAPTGNSIVPTGTITLSSGSYKSSATALSAGSASIAIPANTLPAGADTVTATYSGDTNYPAGSASIALTVSTAPPPNFTISAPSLSLMPGASTSNTVQITLTPVTGFTGTVDLTANITSSPMNATDPPTLSFGSNSSVAITGSAAATATLTIATTAQVISRNTQPGTQPNIPARLKWIASGSAVLACVLLWGIPARRRKGLLAAARNLVLLALLAAAASTALSSCGGHSTKITNPGTTPGAYTITVTGKSGTLTSTGTVTLTIQ